MDKIEKALKKLSKKERSVIKSILKKLMRGTLSRLDVKKLKSRGDIFRVREGDLRIIYRSVDDLITVLAIERRGEGTYK